MLFSSHFILHPSYFILALGGRCGSRTHRSACAPTVFGTAWRARAQPSFVLAGALGFEPRKAGLESASLTFSLRPLDASGRTRTSTLAARAAALQAAAEPFRPLMREIFFGVEEIGKGKN